MKVAVINRNWRYGGSVYFGCRSPHPPLELGWEQAHDDYLNEFRAFSDVQERQPRRLHELEAAA